MKRNIEQLERELGIVVGDVPCDGCVLCCVGDAVRLLPGDDVSQYQTEPHEYIRGELMLAHKPDGRCVYLGKSGCTIHERRPRQCREMDCRVVAAKLTYTKARKLAKQGMYPLPAYLRGRELLKK